MRTLKIYLLVLTLPINLIAQEYPVSIGPVPRIGKPNPGNWTLEHTPTDATVGYAHSMSNHQFVSLPLPGGNPLTIIGGHYYGDFASGGCFGGDGFFYVSTVGSVGNAPEIWKQNIYTGAAMLVGPTGQSYGEGFNGIAYDWTTGIYYGCSSTNLYTFDNISGNATLIGPLNSSGIAIDIAIDCDGTMYMHDIFMDHIYSVDKATGSATSIGYTGFNANFGQGMGFDHDSETLYLFAFNATTYTAQLRTVNRTTGMTTLVRDYGFDQYAPFDGQAGCGPNCPVVAPSNPNPPDGIGGLPIYGLDLSWTNGTGTSEVEIWFGSPGLMSMIYDGTTISTFSLSNFEPLEYSTTYVWRIVDKNDTCAVSGQIWTFITRKDPTQPYLFCDDFENGIGAWTITNDGGTCVWEVFFPPYPNVYMLPSYQSGGVLAADSDECGNGTTMLTTATISETFNLSLNTSAWIEFDNDWNVIGPNDEAHVEISTDGGTSWIGVWDQIGMDIRSTHEIVNISSLTYGQSSVKVRLRSVQPGWDWWWAVDNFCINVDWCYSCTSPSRPTNLTAAYLGSSNVQLNWQDNSFNESGFVIERKDGDSLSSNPFLTVNILEEDNTIYIDSTAIGSSIYTYRLKAYNSWGHSSYSNIAQVSAFIPVELVNFSATVSDKDVQLSWITSTETNNAGFEILRTTNNEESKEKDWNILGFVSGRGTTTETHLYSFTDLDVAPGMHQYKLKQIDYDGSFKYSNIVEVVIPFVNDYSLSQNYPNPFNPTTKIKFTIPASLNFSKGGTLVQLKVYDVLGKEVAILVNEEKSAGEYEVDFDGMNLPSGVYFYQLKAGDFVNIKKMILLR